MPRRRGSTRHENREVFLFSRKAAKTRRKDTEKLLLASLRLCVRPFLTFARASFRAHASKFWLSAPTGLDMNSRGFQPTEQAKERIGPEGAVQGWAALLCDPFQGRCFPSTFRGLKPTAIHIQPFQGCGFAVRSDHIASKLFLLCSRI